MDCKTPKINTVTVLANAKINTETTLADIKPGEFFLVPTNNNGIAIMQIFIKLKRQDGPIDCACAVGIEHGTLETFPIDKPVKKCVWNLTLEEIS